jgi:hypothetical protein
MTTEATRLLIMKRLQACIETVTPGQSDDVFLLTGKVFRGRLILGEEIKPLPAVAIVEAPQSDPNAVFAGDESVGRKDMWNVFVQGKISDDSRHPCDSAYTLAAAVEQRLSRIIDVDRATGNPVYPTDYLLGGLIYDLQILAPVVRPPEVAVSSTAFFYLPLRVGVPVSVGKPYTTV